LIQELLLRVEKTPPSGAGNSSWGQSRPILVHTRNPLGNSRLLVE
jgi:hypothetical protein